MFAILGLDCCSGSKTYLLYLDVTTNIMTFLFYISLFCSFVVLFGNNMDHGIYAFCMLGLLFSICFDFACIDRNYFKKSVFILYDDKEQFIL